MVFLALGAPAGAQAPGKRGDPGMVEFVDDGAGRPWAEGISLEARKKAYQIFLDGNEVMKEALFAKGAEKYRAALELWDHPAFHYNLGVAQMNLDQIIEAYGSFERAVVHGPRPIGQEKHELAEYYLKLLRNQLAEIEVICDEPGAAVALDGKPLFIGPGRQRVMVRPGGHRVEATKVQREPSIQEVVLDPGDNKQVALVLQYPEYLATYRLWPQWIPWTVLGAGAAVMLGGAALDLQSSADFRGYDEDIAKLCSGARGCFEEDVSSGLQGRLDRARLQQQIARGIYTVGGLAAITGTALLYVNRERIVRRRGPVESSQVSFTPVIAPHVAGVSARVQF